MHEWVPVVHDVEEVLDPVMDLATEQCPRLGSCLEYCNGSCPDAAREELINGNASATERPGEEHKLVAWARDAKAVLETCGLGIKGVDGSGVFFHIPSRPMNVERQKQAFIRAGVYHALEIC